MTNQTNEVPGDSVEKIIDEMQRFANQPNTLPSTKRRVRNWEARIAALPAATVSVPAAVMEYLDSWASETCGLDESSAAVARACKEIKDMLATPHAALAAATVPDGWKLVPVGGNFKMTMAASRVYSEKKKELRMIGDMADLIEAAIAAAPLPRPCEQCNGTGFFNDMEGAIDACDACDGSHDEQPAQRGTPGCAEAVAWRISDPREPDLGHWLWEEPCDKPGLMCEPLYLAPAAPAFDTHEDALARVTAAVKAELVEQGFMDPEWTGSDAECEKVARAALRALDASAPPSPAPSDGSAAECHGLDTPERVCFYEQDFYVLSNFSSFGIEIYALKFPTSEHAYHWMKFRTPIGVSEDYAAHRVAKEILNAPSAHQAFKLAEHYKALRRPDWDSVKVDMMRRLLRTKVDQHEYVRRKLLATGDRELVENSWRDDFWGWGPNRDGKNMLGRLWMEIRAELRAAPSEPKP